MKILICYRINQHSTKMSGVFKKMCGQAQALADAGHETYSMYMSLSTFTVSQLENTGFKPVVEHPDVPIPGERENFWRLGIQYLEKVMPDVLYVRYDQMYDGVSLALFFRHARQMGCRCILEFPTYPYQLEIHDEEKRRADERHRAELMPFVDGVSSTHNAPRILEKDNFFFNNRVNGADAAKNLPVDLVFDVTNMRAIAVAYISNWHGFDRLIKGMYLAHQQGTLNLSLDIVGEGPEQAHLAALVQALDLSSHVHFLGYKSTRELHALFARADVGIDTLAPHRKALDLVSSLKGREYLLNGLPVLTSTADAVLADCPYTWAVPCDETSIDVAALTAFLTSLYRQGGVREHAAAYARSHLTWQSWANDFIHWLASHGGAKPSGLT